MLKFINNNFIDLIFVVFLNYKFYENILFIILKFEFIFLVNELFRNLNS